MSEYDDPELDSKWCEGCRLRVIEYLDKENVRHRGVADSPVCHVAPDVSFWAVESMLCPGTVGWSAVCGDCPTDYISSTGISHPREILRAFGRTWVGSRGIYGAR